MNYRTPDYTELLEEIASLKKQLATTKFADAVVYDHAVVTEIRFMQSDKNKMIVFAKKYSDNTIVKFMIDKFQAHNFLPNAEIDLIANKVM